MTITAGSSMAAMSVNGPPHCAQDALSISNTRLSNWAQRMRARLEDNGVLYAIRITSNTVLERRSCAVCLSAGACHGRLWGSPSAGCALLFVLEIYDKADARTAGSKDSNWPL